MANEELEAAVSLFMEQAEGGMGDPHELLMRLKQILHGMAGMGLTPPDDLLRMERELEAELIPPDSSAAD